MIPEPFAISLLVIAVLNELSVPYVIGGSLASAQHGKARATFDSDLIVKLPLKQVRPLVERLQHTFYVDEVAARQAVLSQSSFNLIHLETMFKVDLFVAQNRPFDQAQLARREPHFLDPQQQHMVYLLTAEDTILAKLAWYRLGGEQSERQWNDVLTVVSVQQERLDWEYMEGMAATLAVADLLARIRPAK